MRGYEKDEVDDFLDMIVRDYEEVIQKNISYLKNKEYRFVLEGFFRNLMNLSKLIQNEENHQ